MSSLLRLGSALAAFLALPSVSASTLRGRANFLNGSDVVSQEPVDMASNRYLLSKERRLIAHEGVMRTLIIRVTDGEGTISESLSNFCLHYMPLLLLSQHP